MFVFKKRLYRKPDKALNCYPSVESLLAASDYYIKHNCNAQAVTCLGEVIRQLVVKQHKGGK